MNLHRRRKFRDLRWEAILKDFRDLPWWQEVMVLVVVSFVVVFPCWLAYGYLARSEEEARVTGLQWEREADVEEFRVKHVSDTSMRPPSDAYDVKHWEESYQVPETTYDDEGNASTTYRTEWETRYSYSVNRWMLKKTFRLDAANKNPKWPVTVLEVGPLGKKDRNGRRRATYRVNLLGPRGSMTHDLGLSRWTELEENEIVIAVVNGFGQVVEVK